MSFEIHPYQIEQAVGGKRVLVTGAGGSIGSEIVRLVAKGNPRHLSLLSHSEYPLYKIEAEVRKPGLSVSTALADVRSQSRVLQVCEQHYPDIIFHAAAIKHVPLAEENPCEAILTNTIGTANVAIGAQACDARMVFISTDKAVNPTCVMGATKRAAELYCASMNINVVRFGNVIGTSGSVIPLFQRLIAEGKNLTVTHKDVTRYFMEVGEAAGLVIQTLNIGSGLFVLDMGEPVSIYDLATTMIRESGKDLEIEITGLRPGEKLHEELFYPDEQYTARDGIFHVGTRQRESFYLGRLRQYAEQGDAENALACLREIVPEYQERYENRYLAVQG